MNFFLRLWLRFDIWAQRSAEQDYLQHAARYRYRDPATFITYRARARKCREAADNQAARLETLK